ncbi:hypothetical protein HK101_001077 [Irineochytrium annulatum]|nr:hypothetical protein HK101_001077 [Irineochytrium annulatum]
MDDLPPRPSKKKLDAAAALDTPPPQSPVDAETPAPVTVEPEIVEVAEVPSPAVPAPSDAEVPDAQPQEPEPAIEAADAPVESKPEHEPEVEVVPEPQDEDPVVIDANEALGAPSLDAATEMINVELDKDAEIARLKARVTELEQQVADLHKKAADAAVLDAVPRTGHLSHPNKSRINPRAARSKPSDSSAADRPNSMASLDSQTDIGNIASTTPTTQEPTSAPSPPSAGPSDVVGTPTEGESPSGTDFRKKIAIMGGVSALGGFNPFAGGGAPILKSRGSAAGRTSSGSSEAVDEGEAREREAEIREWFATTSGDTALAADSGVAFSKHLADGTALCRLVSALNPANPVKAKGGKFTFVHKENVNHYFAASEVLGVSKNYAFEFEDLSDEKTFPRVLAHLLLLKKVTEKK